MGVGEVIELLDGLPDAFSQFLADAGEPLMVRETVAMETLANAATARMSGVLSAAFATCFSGH